MSIIVRASAAAIISLFLCITLSKHASNFTVIICIILCCTIFRCAVEYLKPLISFIEKLYKISDLSSEIFEILIKAVGIGFLTEITTLICNDAGYSTIGKSVQILSCILILWLSLPILNGLLDLIERVLEYR